MKPVYPVNLENKVQQDHLDKLAKMVTLGNQVLLEQLVNLGMSVVLERLDETDLLE